MAWQPRYHHVSQLHPGPGGALSGWNDCWEACLARYLRERDPAVTPGDDWALIDTLSRAARGTPDAPDNSDTTLDQAARSLAAYGIEAAWTASYQQALAAAWAICLVDGTILAPAQYPAAWFGAPAPGGNHFVLWLPYWRGSAAWFNDPLAYLNGQEDCQYDLGSVADAFYGAYLLSDTGNGEAAPVSLTVATRCALKLLPNHSCIALGDLAVGSVVTALPDYQGIWRHVRLADGRVGWAPRACLRAAGASS